VLIPAVHSLVATGRNKSPPADIVTSVFLDHLGELTDDAIRHAVGAAAYRRGAAYAQQDRVVELDVAPDGAAAVGLVHGTGIYRTVVNRQDGRWSGRRESLHSRTARRRCS
jgi:hypothetical protein